MRAPAPRWGPLPWFVLVLTGLVVLLVVVLPPLVLAEPAPGWVERGAARISSWHGDPDPVEGVWVEMTWDEAARLMVAAEAGEASGSTDTKSSEEPSPTPSPEASAWWESKPRPRASNKTVTDPGRTMYLVAMRGRYDSGPHGGPPPSTAPERWLLIAYDGVTRDRWHTAVLNKRPDLPDDMASFLPF